MTYKECLEFLYSTLPMFHRVGAQAYKANLNNANALDEYFSHPHKKFKTIHVGGTNGKGSTSHMLASVLISAGYRVGLFTSPHLVDFRERIKINGEMIPENEVVNFIEQHQAIINKIKPSFFELTSALAFEYFAAQNVDVAIIEVGMGGRLDSTNIITPVLSIITNISFDHTQFLGSTIAEIAVEKAGIIKPHVPVVIGESSPESATVFIAKAAEAESQIIFADKFYTCTSAKTEDAHQVLSLKSLYDGYEFTLRTDLLGEYQRKNILTVLTAMDVLAKGAGFKISRENAEYGIANTIKITSFEGRWQIISHQPLIVCDTAHNEAGLKLTVSQIENTPHKKLFMVIGAVEDKDVNKMLSIVPKDAFYIFTQASIPRALEAGKLAEIASTHGIKGEVINSVSEAVKKALSKAGKEDMIYIGGSTFVVADFLESNKKGAV